MSQVDRLIHPEGMIVPMNRGIMFKRLEAKAQRQHGLVTRRQALEAGLSDKVLGRMRRDRQLKAVGAAVYRMAGVPSTWEQAVLAACLPGDGCASHGTALRLYGISVDGNSGINVTVRRGARRTGSTRTGIRIHSTRSIDSNDVRVRSNVPVTSPERTLLDMAAGTIGEDGLEVLLCEFLQRGLVKGERLMSWLASPHRRPGINALRRAARTVLRGGALESPAELKMLQLFRRAGLPEPERQYRIRDERRRVVARLDFAWPEFKLGFETDGFGFHGSYAAFNGDRLRDLVVKELGWEVIRASPELARDHASQVVRTIAARLRAGVGELGKAGPREAGEIGQVEPSRQPAGTRTSADHSTDVPSPVPTFACGERRIAVRLALAA